MEQPEARLMREPISTKLEENERRFRRILRADVNSDARFRRLHAFGRDMCLVSIEGMADDGRIGEFVLRCCLKDDTPLIPDARALVERCLTAAQCRLSDSVEDIVQGLVTGMSCLLIDGCGDAVMLETRGSEARRVDRTTNESVVIGAQEGFVENLRANLTLLRRYLPSPHLISESLAVGTGVPCRVALVYLDGVADPGVVDRVRQRVKCVRAPVVQGLGALGQLIEDDPGAILPQMLQTERPDRAASCLTEGQVVLLADNSPCALIMPVSLFHHLHASDDTFARWQYGSFLRLIRFLGALISVFLPGLYIALTGYHMHLIPLNLLGAIAEARARVPFPILTEILIMEFSFYLINEAGTRIPSQIGSALGIVGALILGQAAVSASIISPILIIIVALTGLGNYAVPDYGFGIGLVLYRLFAIALGAALGLYGLCIAAFCMLVGVCAMKSLGFPYVAPVAPARPHNPDILLRLPLRRQGRPMYYARPDSWLKPRDRASPRQEGRVSTRHSHEGGPAHEA